MKILKFNELTSATKFAAYKKAADEFNKTSDDLKMKKSKLLNQSYTFSKHIDPVVKNKIESVINSIFNPVKLDISKEIFQKIGTNEYYSVIKITFSSKEKIQNLIEIKKDSEYFDINFEPYKDLLNDFNKRKLNRLFDFLRKEELFKTPFTD